MHASEIVPLLTRRPFEPFSLQMSDGVTYEIRHPDQVLLTPRALHVGMWPQSKPFLVQEVVICDFVHITRLGPAVKRQPRRRAG